MNWGSVFWLTNAVAVAGWLMLLFLPRRPLVLSVLLFACVGLLCAIYTASFVSLFGGMADPVRMPGSPVPNMADYSVAGLKPFFMSDGGIVVGWTHYLAFDLFVGLWIARDGDSKGFSRLVQVPVLILTFIAGPIGLLVWLIVREPRAQAAARQRRR